MNKNKIITYSLLAHINNNGNLVTDLFEVFKPLVKRALMKMNATGVIKGKNISEIKIVVDDLYKLDIPLPVLRIILKRISDEIQATGVGKFILYRDGAFEISNYVFIEFEELMIEKENEIKKLEELFEEFCTINKVEKKSNQGIFEFIESNKLTISRYLIHSKGKENTDFTIEALFVQYFKKFNEVYDLIKNIYLGSIISSYLEYQTKEIEINIELLFDTNFIVSLLDLKTSESTHTCRKLIDIVKAQGYKLFVLDITLEETRVLLERKSENFDNSFLLKKVDEEDIYNACDRRGLSKTDLERISDNMETTLESFGVIKVPNSTKYQNIAKNSDEYHRLKLVRHNDFAALHDATVLFYVREKRGKKIKDFEKVNCWLVNNSSAWHSSDNFFQKKENGFQPEVIRAEDFINILWLSNPNTKKEVGENELVDIGITRLISCTLNETLPKSTIIRELDDNIKKYAVEKISDKDILRVGTRIAKRSLKNIDELNKIAQKNQEEFIKRLQREADIEREEDEQRTKAFQDLIKRMVLKEKEMDEAKENYRNKLLDSRKKQHEVVDRVLEKENELIVEKSKLRKTENELRKIKRETFINSKLRSWRLKNWFELGGWVGGFLFILIYILYLSNWEFSKALALIESMKQNVIISILVWFIVLIFSAVSLNSLVSKYRTHSNIKAFIDNLERFEMPDEFKELK